jgi:hypothetical protein
MSLMKKLAKVIKEDTMKKQAANVATIKETCKGCGAKKTIEIPMDEWCSFAEQRTNGVKKVIAAEQSLKSLTPEDVCWAGKSLCPSCC